MDFLTLGIAVGIILLLAYWSGRHRLKAKKKQQKPNSKVSKIYPLAKAKNQTKLRRVK
ncbi:hypothetical protein [Desulfosporosinus youngiae]|uniref:Uncharacterized protein n=1 Tax=Desulfosporosinus youngiae DSM 17734 TaxID=768710 RepID=H5XSW0_9FIRM|nr:hypothetical protein [Desulfosporosinus youngiae]EHQ87923.1 hypothetical protein DesyoDRAFT_0747 [Desulfosporosinus youngiae DSM 17734]